MVASEVEETVPSLARKVKLVRRPFRAGSPYKVGGGRYHTPRLPTRLPGEEGDEPMDAPVLPPHAFNSTGADWMTVPSSPVAEHRKSCPIGGSPVRLMN